MVEKTNTNCKIRGTELCNFIGCDGCDRCTFAFPGSTKGMDLDVTANRWRETLELIPREVDELHTTDTCVFCNAEAKDGYAELSLGHSEPEFKKGMILGMGKKVRCEIGSLIDVPISCCKSCKRRVVMQDVLRYAIILAFLLVGIALMAIPAISNVLENIYFLLPLAAVVVMVLIGYGVANVAVNAYIRRCQEKMIVDPLEIPTIKKMLQVGWFPVPQTKKGAPHLHFSKKKIRENFRYFSE